jgi:hypothetical protein
MSFYEIDRTSNLSRVDQLLAKDPEGSKQFQKVSAFSPGPVADDELLVRSLEYPNKFDGSGGLSDALFEDAFKHGASAQRLVNGWDVHVADVHRGFEERAASKRAGDEKRRAVPDNLYIGSFHMTAYELRAIQMEVDIQPRVRVYDAGQLETDSLHAEIVADGRGLARPLKHELRVRLMVLAQQRGLYVSPFLSEEGLGRALGCRCTLNYPPAPPPPSVPLLDT